MIELFSAEVHGVAENKAYSSEKYPVSLIPTLGTINLLIYCEMVRRRFGRVFRFVPTFSAGFDETRH